MSDTVITVKNLCIRREVDDRIEPVLIEKDHDESGFLSEIMKKGIKI